MGGPTSCCDPRPPRGRRPTAAPSPRLGYRVAIHAPLAGGDHFRQHTLHDCAVAIHAPLAGGDEAEAVECVIAEALRSTPPSREATTGSRVDVPIAISCDPRPPRGRRQATLHDHGQTHKLRSTPPSREATLPDDVFSAPGRVAIHAPLAGGDMTGTPLWHGTWMLRSTPPSREATADRWLILQHQHVAIHAPLAGGDNEATSHRGPTTKLRSTPPSREATRPRLADPDRRCVAIHAPLAGGDIIAQTDVAPPPVAIHAPLAGGDSDTSNVVARHTIEGEVREPRRPPAWRVYRSSPAGSVNPCRSTICGERAKLPGEA